VIEYKFKCEPLGKAFEALSRKYAHPDEIEGNELEEMGVPKLIAETAMMLLVDYVISDEGFAAWLRWMHLMALRGL
jgi:hypothetical protein